MVPYDHAAVQRSIAAQRPVVLDRGSRAGRALIEFASRVHGRTGRRLVLPPEPDAPQRRGLGAVAERLGNGLRVPSLVGSGHTVEKSDAELTRG